MLKDNLEWGFAHLGKENFATKLKSDVVRFLSLLSLFLAATYIGTLEEHGLS